jgi:ABC-type amino acid transport substrate-binding protein
MRKGALVLLLLFSYRGMPAAENETEAIRAGIHVSPPFTMVYEEGWRRGNGESGGYYGMAIELWKIVEKELGFRTVYVPYQTVDELLAALQRGTIDVALTNLTITHERAQKVKFTYPWYDAGQRIMVKTVKKNTFWEDFKRNGQIPAYIALFGLFVLIAIVVTLIRRRIDPGFTRTWIEGLFCSLYEVIVTSRSGRLQRDFGWVGYALCSVWMFFGIAAVAYLTSTITSSMTTASLTQTSINSPADLHGKLTGVLAGSASEDYLRGVGTFLSTFADIDEAGTALMEGRVEAVVADAPVVEYWTYTHPAAGVTPAGDLFRHEKYAFALNRHNDRLAERVSLELIYLHELGLIAELKAKFMGSIGQ